MADAQHQNGELAISMAQDISSQTEKCQDLFSIYLDMSTPCRERMLNFETRFLTWASILAVIDDESICLDRRLRYSPDIKELVTLMLSALQRGLERAISRHPLMDAMVQDDAAMFAITGAISRLDRLVPIIQERESPLAQEAMQVRRLIMSTGSDGFAVLVSNLIKELFPDAELTLQSQLMRSVIYRRYRLVWNRINSNRLKDDKETENADPGARKSQQNMTGINFSYPLPYPDPPKMAHGESKMNCRYCFDDIIIPQSANKKQKRAQWEAHLEADLKPYVCLSEECRRSLMFFSTAEEWKDHMESHYADWFYDGDDWFQNIHRNKWQCAFCNDDATCFLTKDELEFHLLHEEAPNHPPDPADWNLLVLEKSRMPNPRNKHRCPLCNMEQKGGTPSERSNRLYTHFLAHLEHLALVSIYSWDVEIAKTIDVSINSTDSANVGVRNLLPRRSGTRHDQEKVLEEEDGVLFKKCLG